MKTLVLTPNSHPAYFSKSKNLGQLIALIEQQGEKDNLFIVKMLLNDRKMDQEEEKLLDSLGIADVKKLEVTMGDLSEIISQTLADIIASIQELQGRSITFSREFRKLNSVDDEKVKYLLVQCRSIIDSLEEVFAIHTRQQFLIKHHSLWVEAEKELTNIIHCVLQARQYTQNMFICDLIEYDLVQALDSWEEALEKELIDNSQLSGNFGLNIGDSHSDNGVDA